MPLIEIIKPGLHGPIKRTIGDVPDQSGVYPYENGTLAITMKRRESTSVNQQVIVLHAEGFFGHGKHGRQERIVQIGKKGYGTIQLSREQMLRVSLRDPKVDVIKALQHAHAAQKQGVSNAEAITDLVGFLAGNEERISALLQLTK